LPSGLDASAISRDKTVVDNYLKDKLVHDKISAIMGVEMIETGKDVINQANKIKIPVLVYHGNADRLTSHDGSRKFAENVGNNATFISYDGLYHETHNEPEKDKVFENIILWIDKL
jgi:alpha-beta hydrolase superfamily lysophospholipase